MGLTPHRPRSDPEGTGAACPWQRDANNSGAARDNGGTLPGRTNAVFNTELEQLALLLGKGCSASPGNGGQQQQHPHPLPQPEPTSGQRAPGCSGMSRDEPGRAGMSRDEPGCCLHACPHSLPSLRARSQPGVESRLCFSRFFRVPASRGGWIIQPSPKPLRYSC